VAGNTASVKQGALQRFDPSLDPREAALPLTRLPGLPVPTLVPVPNLQRLYFKICTPVDTLQLGLDVKRDAAGWQQLYDDVKGTGECQCCTELCKKRTIEYETIACLAAVETRLGLEHHSVVQVGTDGCIMDLVLCHCAFIHVVLACQDVL